MKEHIDGTTAETTAAAATAGYRTGAGGSIALAERVSLAARRVRGINFPFPIIFLE
jgi:hypothetical protein